MSQTIRTLKRGDIVKVGGKQWIVRTALDDYNRYVYKWPSKKTKLYSLTTPQDADAPENDVVVFEVGGSGQRIGPLECQGPIERKGFASLD